VDVLIDLLPSVNRVKTETSKKDKRQRNKYSRQMNSSNLNIVKGYEGSDPVAELKQVFWDGPERRNINDRRQLKNKRGRWLESRDRKDRRAVEYAISVKI
jgi:hypothetical protein